MTVDEPSVYMQVPPPDCFSCFLVAVSNLYPGVYYTFPTPFSIGSHEYSDLRDQQCVGFYFSVDDGLMDGLLFPLEASW